MKKKSRGSDLTNKYNNVKSKVNAILRGSDDLKIKKTIR